MEEQHAVVPVATHIANVGKGALVGMANAIPGVSGGTIAVVTGIYERSIDAFSDFFRGGWRRNLMWLLPIAAGVLLGLVAFSWIIDFFFNNYPEQTRFFFIGLILGSLPFLIKRAQRDAFKAVNILPLIIALALVVVMAVVSEPSESPPITEVTPVTALVIVAAGAIGSATMIVPGVSGSFILLLLGLYTTMINGFRTLNLPVLVLFVFGSIVGIVVIAKLIHLLLERFYTPTYWAIIGLVLGSVASIWPGFTLGLGGLFSVLAAALGFGAAFLLGSDRKPAAGDAASGDGVS